MKFFFMIIIFLNSFIACTTLKKQQFYSGLAGSFIGGTVGALIGEDLSPDQHSIGLNQTIGLSTGVIVGGLAGISLGTFFWSENPENRQLKQMILDEKRDEVESALGPQGRVQQDAFFQPLRPSSGVTYPLQEGPIPEDFRNLITKKGRVRFYEVPQFSETLENDREIIHQAHKAWEYVIENDDLNEPEARDLSRKDFQ